jgi:signal transduction histidine kinase
MKSQMHFQIDSKKTVRAGDKWPASHQFHDQFHGLPLLHKTLTVNIPLMSAETAQLLEERRTFAIAAQAIREEEKARLARELHDELAQSLTALKMDAIWVRDHALSVPGRVIDKLTEMVEMLDRTVAATRRMAADLRPLMLDDLGLVPAIEWLASSFMQRCGVPCTLSVNDEPALELPEPYATAVFRIVQESLNNIAKHAAASQVLITLDKTLDTVRLRVEDDGCGFLCNGMRKPQSLGLLGLRERAQLLGGSVAIRSARGKGTTVEVSIPLHQMGVPQ